MRKLLLLVLFVITAKVLFAQSLFQKQLAIGYDSYLSDVVCNESDSTYYYVGRIMVIESSAFVQKPIVFKTDNMGNIIWFKIIVVSPVLDSSSIFTRIIKGSSAGTFVILGGTSGYVLSQPSGFGYVLIIDSAGSVLNTQTYNVTNQEGYKDIIQTKDGGYAITGGIGWNYSTNTTGNVLLLKLDSQLNFEWAKSYGDTVLNVGESIIQLPDSGYIISGNTRTTSYYDPDIFVMRTDAGGNQSWLKILKDSAGDSNHNQLAYTLDGNVTLAYNSLEQSGSLLYFLKMDLIGNTLWQRGMGFFGSGSFQHYIEESDGGFIFCRQWLWKLDSAGNHVWTQQHNTGPYQYGCVRICNSVDSGFVIAGYRGLSNSNIFIQKTDSVGFMGCNGIIHPHFNFSVTPFSFDNTVFLDSLFFISPTNLSTSVIDTLPAEMLICPNGINDLSINTLEIEVYPNQVTDQLKIKFNKMVSHYWIEIVDFNGKIILQKRGKNKMYDELNVSGISQGMYFIKVIDSTDFVVKKIIKL